MKQGTETSGSDAASFRDYWPSYLGKHRDSRTRWGHFLGTGAGILMGVFVGWRLIEREYFWALPACFFAGLLTSYVFTFSSHAFFERNRAAVIDGFSGSVFRGILEAAWAVRADLQMTFLHFSGKLQQEFERLGIETRGPSGRPGRGRRDPLSKRLAPNPPGS